MVRVNSAGSELLALQMAAAVKAGRICQVGCFYGWSSLVSTRKVFCEENVVELLSKAWALLPGADKL